MYKLEKIINVLPSAGISERRLRAIMTRIFELAKSKPRSVKTNDGDYVCSLTPLFIFASWAYNATEDCSDQDYLGTAPAGTKNREQMWQQFHEMSAKVRW